MKGEEGAEVGPGDRRGDGWGAGFTTGPRVHRGAHSREAGVLRNWLGLRAVGIWVGY